MADKSHIMPEANNTLELFTLCLYFKGLEIAKQRSRVNASILKTDTVHGRKYSTCKILINFREVTEHASLK